MHFIFVLLNLFTTNYISKLHSVDKICNNKSISAIREGHVHVNFVIWKCSIFSSTYFSRVKITFENVEIQDYNILPTGFEQDTLHDVCLLCD